MHGMLLFLYIWLNFRVYFSFLNSRFLLQLKIAKWIVELFYIKYQMTDGLLLFMWWTTVCWCYRNHVAYHSAEFAISEPFVMLSVTFKGYSSFSGVNIF